jgi:hypothetical protein
VLHLIAYLSGEPASVGERDGTFGCRTGVVTGRMPVAAPTIVAETHGDAAERYLRA